MQLGLASDDAEPEAEIKSKATEVIAKKAGVSSSELLNVGKKYWKKAVKMIKQKLRERKN